MKNLVAPSVFNKIYGSETPSHIILTLPMAEDLIKLNTQDIVPYQEVDPDTYDSDVMETETLDEDGEEGGEEQGD